MSARLPAALNRQLQRDSDLSLQDFDVLVQLTDTEDGRRAGLRAGGRPRLGAQPALAPRHAAWSGAAWSQREECGDDGRGAFVVLTPAGRAAIERAAPDHVRDGPVAGRSTR